MAEIKKDILHPDGQPNVDIYPKTSVDQVENLNVIVEHLNTAIDYKVNNTTFDEAMKSKVTRSNRPYIIYGTNHDISTDYFYNVAIEPLLNSIPMRTPNGTLKTQTPISSNDCVNLKYFKQNKKVYRHFVCLTCLASDDITEYGYYLHFYSTKNTFSIDDLKPTHDDGYNVYNVVRGRFHIMDITSTCIAINSAGEILIKDGLYENLISVDVLETVEV